MQSKVLTSFGEAVADIPDGASIFIAGFGPGVPHNLIRALYEQGARNLTIIANSAGTGSTASRGDDLVTTSTLVEARRVRKVIAAFTAATHPSHRVAIEELHESGELEAEVVPQGTLAERIRAGGSGIPAFYTPAGVGTEVAAGKEHRDFDGRTYLLEHALRADYALIRAWRADEFGNLAYKGSQRNFNPIMAAAADCTIVEAEEIVAVGALAPEQVHTSGIFVQRIVRIGPADILHIALPGSEPRPAPSSPERRD